MCISSVAGLGIGIHEAIVYGMGRPSGFFTLIIALHLQFLFGLMIMSSLAPTSLAEERVRGSLDVLMTTPLSSRSILWGKWLGTYRVVLWLAVLPGLASVIVACMAPPCPRDSRPQRPTTGAIPVDLLDRIVAPGLVVGEMLAYGAAITSMGLALATWVPSARPRHRHQRGHLRPDHDRLAALLRVRHLASARRWMATWEVIGTDTRWLAGRDDGDQPLLGADGDAGMAPGSPRRAIAWKFWLLAPAWCVLAWAFAAAMFWATLKTFDRCLGRMPETSVPEDGDPAVRFGGPESGDLDLVVSSAAPSPRLAGAADGRQYGDR